MNALFATRMLIRDILENPHERDWTLQGLGMLRTYIGDTVRMHIWDSRYRVPNVSMLHDHPWHFESLIVAGSVVNYRYFEVPGTLFKKPAFGSPYMKQALKCGEGGGLCAPPTRVYLERQEGEALQVGATYYQAAHEIHKSIPLDGAITLIQRTFRPDTETANVYYREDDGWVSAEPRAATADEVEAITSYSLEAGFVQGRSKTA